MDNKQREKGIILTSGVGILGNVLLVAAKAFIGFLAGSVSIIMDALNNLTDALSSIITIIGTKLSNKRPNKKHPYGYGRIEYITSTIIGLLVLFAGGTAIYESIESIINYYQNGVMPDYNNLTLIIVSVAIVIKVGLGIFFKIKGKKYQSDALSASGVDALFDSLLSLGTLVSVLVAMFANFYIEGYVGIVIGLFILKSGIGIVKDAMSSMIGQRAEEDLANSIKDDIKQIPEVNGVFDLILNDYGNGKMIGSVHVGVKDNLTAKEIHNLEREINGLLYQKYHIVMTTGIYAENIDSPVSKAIKEHLISLLKDYPTVVQLHGFYLDEEKKVCNFDLVINFDDKHPEETVASVVAKLNEQFADYTIIGNLDNDF